MKAEEFDRALAESRLSLCMIGMSNCGKSFRSTQFHKERGFQLTCIDGLIEERLGPELTALGYAGIEGLATWMGQPYEQQFPANQARYLECEEELTMSSLPTPGQNFVLDTTGSVINLKAPEKLRESFLVVHIQASEDMLEGMVKTYFACPKPVAWGDAFNQQPGESGEAALRRCYPELLRSRIEKYSKLAHVNVPAKIALGRDISCEQFLQAVRDALKAQE
mmetsp:Transcript_7820/g.18170  ORF Transcript_7820/g.18170 Transcript_7820/m.18170 type:complete len:222 (+) Transcript_7820:26-691(+)